MAFAIWLTGLPASGKSTIARAVHARLADHGVVIDVLESDEVRRVLTPKPSYSRSERDLFYRALAFTGTRLVKHGINVLFDATANKRAYRDFARDAIPHFLEVFVDCPLSVCQARDEKGTYAKGKAGSSRTVPGSQEPYEAPLAPDLHVDTTALSSDQAAEQILSLLNRRGLIR